MSRDYQKFQCLQAAPHLARQCREMLKKTETAEAEGCAAIQRDFSSLEEQQRSSMEFSFTGNTKPCTWGRTTLSMLTGKGLGRESPEGPDGHQAGPEPALCSEKQWVSSPLGCVRQS